MTKSRAVENKRLGLVELYGGIGCVARGFERTGRFETLLLTDVRNARDHYKTNYPGGAPYMYRDVGDIRASDIEDTPRRDPCPHGIRTDPLQGVHPDLIRVVERAGP